MSSFARARDSNLQFMLIAGALLFFSCAALGMYLIKRAPHERTIKLSRLVRMMIHCISPKQTVENVLGDLQEEYEFVFRASGRIKARLYGQLYKSTIPFIYSRAKNAIFSWSSRVRSRR